MTFLSSLSVFFSLAFSTTADGGSSCSTEKTRLVAKEFPFVASVEDDERVLCLGGLVSGWHVVTTAHCLENREHVLHIGRG